MSSVSSRMSVKSDETKPAVKAEFFSADTSLNFVLCFKCGVSNQVFSTTNTAS